MENGQAGKVMGKLLTPPNALERKTRLVWNSNTPSLDM
jgi:hypothetical protein